MKFLKNNKALEIVEAEPEDAEAIIAYLKQVGSESSFLLLDATGIKMTLEQEKQFIENCKKIHGTGLFLGRVDKKIVSICGIHNKEIEKIKHNGTLGISVLKDYWNIGVGRFMMEFAINFARIEQVIKNINLEVRADNEFAIKLYKDLGFKEIGRYPDKFYVDKKYIDTLLMQLQLH